MVSHEMKIIFENLLTYNWLYIVASSRHIFISRNGKEDNGEYDKNPYCTTCWLLIWTRPTPFTLNTLHKYILSRTQSTKNTTDEVSTASHRDTRGEKCMEKCQSHSYSTFLFSSCNADQLTNNLILPVFDLKLIQWLSLFEHDLRCAG